jgi:succinoglycan biosynthesis transport protein ExoP
MNVNTLEPAQSPDAWQYDDEIDLRQYLEVLFRWWREIVLITIGSAVLAAIVILTLRTILPPVYVASADVAIARMASDVSFDERFITSADQVGSDVTSAGARRSALLGLVTSGGVAIDVINELGDQLSAEERSPAVLLERIEAEAGPAIGNRVDSDLIRITVSADSPEKAAAIANAWAQAYVRHVNAIYSQVPDEVLASIQTELEVAEDKYYQAQAQLEAFLATNQLKELNSQLTVYQQRMDQEVALIQAYLAEWQRTNEYLTTARALLAQLEQGGEGAMRSSVAALQSLKLTIYGRPTNNVVFELRDLPEITYEEMLADLNGLIASLEQRLTTLHTEIVTRSDGLAPSSLITDTVIATFSPLYDEIRQLQARIESENAQNVRLSQQRDLSWETYKALSSKIAELSLAIAASGSEVRFAALAVPPADPVKGPSLVIAVLGGGFIGFLVAALYAFIANSLRRRPFLTQRSTG